MKIHAVFIRFSHQGLDVDPVPQGTVEIPLGSTRAMAWVPRSARAVETFAANPRGQSLDGVRLIFAFRRLSRHKMLMFDG